MKRRGDSDGCSLALGFLAIICILFVCKGCIADVVYEQGKAWEQGLRDGRK